MTTLTQFPIFPLLPFELRLKIWGHALTQPRTVTISCKKSLLDIERRVTEYFIYLTRPHPLLHVCHESRDEVLNTYSYIPRFKTNNSDRCMYINFHYDTIRCAASVLEYIGEDEVAEVRKMVLEVGDAAYFGHFHMDTIRRMQSLEELDLLMQKGETYSWNASNDVALENLVGDFESERISDPGWRCPRVRMVNAVSGEETRVLEGGPLIEGWKHGDEYPSDLLNQ